MRQQSYPRPLFRRILIAGDNGKRKGERGGGRCLFLFVFRTKVGAGRGIHTWLKIGYFPHLSVYKEALIRKYQLTS